MRLGFWSRSERECDCRMSPARLLANSLTDPETRGEWTREREHSVYTRRTIYRNEARDITVSRYFFSGHLTFGSGITTPFTLNAAEEKIVREALDAFDRHERDKTEERALARLTAPREELKPASTSPAKPRKPGSR